MATERSLIQGPGEAGPSGVEPVGASAVRVRRLAATDLPDLERFVARATERGELVASSDPEASYFVRYAAVDPANVAVALAGDALVGVLSPEFKLVSVDPAYRRHGVGRRLVAEGIEIERERGRPDLLLGRMPDDDTGAAFLSAVGLAYHSTLWDLALPEDRSVPAVSWPPDLVARSFDRTRDGETFVAVFNAAFAGHPTPIVLDPAQFELLDDPEIEDADTLLVATRARPDEAIAFCATAPRRPGGIVAPVGDIWTIGVRPDWQGRGLGRELLRWGVARLRSIGVTRVTLSVNGRNERALGLYEREGFARERTRERWARPIEPETMGAS